MNGVRARLDLIVEAGSALWFSFVHFSSWQLSVLSAIASRFGSSIYVIVHIFDSLIGAKARGAHGRVQIGSRLPIQGRLEAIALKSEASEC
jgi:hypothetical protein